MVERGTDAAGVMIVDGEGSMQASKSGRGKTMAGGGGPGLSAGAVGCVRSALSGWGSPRWMAGVGFCFLLFLLFLFMLGAVVIGLDT